MINMEKIAEAGFVLSKRELVFLAAITGADEIYGIEDNISQMGKEKINEEWQKAREQLQEKKYIEVELDNSITIDDELYALLEACCRPRAYFNYSGSEEGEPLHYRNIYINERIAVELDQDRVDKDTWILTPLVTLDKAAYNLKECFFTEKNYEKNGVKFEVTQEEFEEINNLFEKEDKLKTIEFLINSGCSKDYAGDLFEAINGKNLFKSLFTIIFDYDNITDFFNYSLYYGEKYIWQIDTSGLKNNNKENKIIFSSVSSEDIANGIDKVMNSLRHIFNESIKGEEFYG
jgi:hypothetical protein